MDSIPPLVSLVVGALTDLGVYVLVLGRSLRRLATGFHVLHQRPTVSNVNAEVGGADLPFRLLDTTEGGVTIMVAIAKRTSQVLRITRREGPQALAARVVRILSQRMNNPALDFPLLDEDIADSSKLEFLPVPPRPPIGSRLVIGWISTPPSRGSGGHTTMFRMIEGLEAAGHECILYLYDRYAGDLATQVKVIRECWPGIRAEVRDSRDLGQAGPLLDGCVATSWNTAHVLAKRPVATRRFYFVQDFEPFFYPRGSEYALVEDTYHFGFKCIAVGHMVANLLRERCADEPVVAEFSCDTEVYKLTNRNRRAGVVFYAKPDVPRRGYRVGVLALEQFHRKHPEQPIHLFGAVPRKLPFPVVAHATMSPSELNRLYNQTIAGLAMSFTNISLVAEEMLASGTIPIVNASPESRADLHHPSVRWARPTPNSLAEALSAAVEAEDIIGQATSASTGIRTDGWNQAKGVVLSTIEAEIYRGNGQTE